MAATVVVALVSALGIRWLWQVNEPTPPCIEGLRIDGFTQTHRWYDAVEDVSRSYWHGPPDGDVLQTFHLHQVRLQQPAGPDRYGVYDLVARGHQPAGVSPDASVWVYRLRELGAVRAGVLDSEFEARDLSDAQQADVRQGTATLLLVTVLCQ